MSHLPTPQTMAEERLAREIEARKRDFERALAALTEPQQRVVQAYLKLGHRRAAVAAAGYARTSYEATRLWRNPSVLAAIEAGVALRSADAKPITKEALIQRLEAMLEVRREDLLLFNEDGKPIGVKDLASLPAATQAAIKTLRAKVRRSARGERAHIVDLELELVDPLRVAELLARVHGWVKTGPAALAAVQNVVRAAPRAGQDAEFVHLMESIERASQQTRA